jgi:CDP-diacylglycerol--serine O-phosphatidyltransferase
VVKRKSQRSSRSVDSASSPFKLHAVARGYDRRGIRRGVSLLPSLFTLANLFCGWACVVYAMKGDVITAAPFIGFAVVLDMLDGRIARMTGTTSDFGVQLDSLADLISFGMAPAVLAFQWGLDPLGRMGWAVGFVYLTAAALRLARFNIQVVTDKRYFVGLPSPAAAGLVAATVFYFPNELTTYRLSLLGALMLLVPALLMVSTIKFQSFKTFDLGMRRGYRGLFVVAAFIALLVTYPHEVLIVLAYSYFASGFIGTLMSKGRKIEPATDLLAPQAPKADAPTPESARAEDVG